MAVETAGRRRLGWRVGIAAGVVVVVALAALVSVLGYGPLASHGRGHPDPGGHRMSAIVAFAPRASGIAEISALSRKIFAAAAERDLHLALAELPIGFFQDLPDGVEKERRTLTSLRSVLMKPDHLDWIDRIWEIIQLSARG